MEEKKTINAYCAYTLALGNRKETRFVCLQCDEVKEIGGMFECRRDGELVGQFDRGAIDIFYYTGTGK